MRVPVYCTLSDFVRHLPTMVVRTIYAVVLFVIYTGGLYALLRFPCEPFTQVS